MLPADMRRVALSLVLVLIGAGLIGGFLTQVVPDDLIPSGFRSLGTYVGTNGSVAGAIFGVGVLWAATNPPAHRAWIILVIAYAVLLVVYQIYAGAVLNSRWELAPIIFGIFAGGLVAALYPTRPRPQPSPEAPPPAEAGVPAAPRPDTGSGDAAATPPNES